MSRDDVIISSFARTPIGGFQGALSGLTATQLGAVAIKAAIERGAVPLDAIDRIYMGCVLAAGLGQAPARQAALGAGLPLGAEATTVNKMCGSGMQATIMAVEAVKAGSADIIVAGGMESMSNAPYLLAKHRSGARIGHDTVKDSMYLDGLEDAYAPGTLMGAFAETTAKNHQITRTAQDDYATKSLTRARVAIETGAFEREITPVLVRTRGVETEISIDEQPGKARLDKIPLLRPAFAEDGTITAATSSSISDGAAALIISRAEFAETMGLRREARLAATAAHAQAPDQFTTAPIQAILKLLKKAGWAINDVDLFEINEAFAVVAMVAMRTLAIPHERVNVNGGACALGHPIGASGARIIATLVAALRNRGLSKGVAAICIGGGEATAVAVELI